MTAKMGGGRIGWTRRGVGVGVGRVGRGGGPDDVALVELEGVVVVAVGVGWFKKAQKTDGLRGRGHGDMVKPMNASIFSVLFFIY